MDLQYQVECNLQVAQQTRIMMNASPHTHVDCDVHKIAHTRARMHVSQDPHLRVGTHDHKTNGLAVMQCIPSLMNAVEPPYAGLCCARHRQGPQEIIVVAMQVGLLMAGQLISGVV